MLARKVTAEKWNDRAGTSDIEQQSLPRPSLSMLKLAGDSERLHYDWLLAVKVDRIHEDS